MPDDNPQGGENKAEALQKLLNKHNGDAMATLGILFSENYDLREKNRKLKEQQPAEGSFVVTKADHDKLEAYKALGKPDELKTRLDSHATLETENAELKREGLLRDVAADMGWKVGVLKDRDRAAGGKLEYVPKEEGEGEKKRRVWHVKTEQGEVALEKHAEKEWADYVPALKVESQQSGGRQWPSQDAGGKPPAPQTREQVIAEEKRKARASGQYAL